MISATISALYTAYADDVSTFGTIIAEIDDVWKEIWVKINGDKYADMQLDSLNFLSNGYFKHRVLKNTRVFNLVSLFRWRRIG